jgi:hypothetical protein
VALHTGQVTEHNPIHQDRADSTHCSAVELEPGRGAWEQILHADKAYDFGRCREALRKRGIKSRVARRGIESSQQLGRHRWSSNVRPRVSVASDACESATNGATTFIKPSSISVAHSSAGASSNGFVRRS